MKSTSYTLVSRAIGSLTFSQFSKTWRSLYPARLSRTSIRIWTVADAGSCKATIDASRSLKYNNEYNVARTLNFDLIHSKNCNVDRMFKLALIYALEKRSRLSLGPSASGHHYTSHHVLTPILYCHGRGMSLSPASKVRNERHFAIYDPYTNHNTNIEGDSQPARLRLRPNQLLQMSSHAARRSLDPSHSRSQR